MTRGEIIFSVARALGLDDTPKDTDNPADELILLQRWVNQGIRDVLIKTKCRLDEGDMTLQTDITEYRIDSDILVVDEVTSASDVPGVRITLTSVPNQVLTELLNAGTGISGTAPSFYYIRGNLMRVAPVPSGPAVLRYFYTPRPLEIPADGTTAADATDLAAPQYGGIPEEYHDAVELFVLWKASAYDDKTSGARGRSAGSTNHDDYQGRIKEIRKELRGKAGRGMHAGRVGYPNRTGVPRRNDTYPTYT